MRESERKREEERELSQLLLLSANTNCWFNRLLIDNFGHLQRGY